MERNKIKFLIIGCIAACLLGLTTSADHLKVYHRMPGLGWSNKFTVYFTQGKNRTTGNNFILNNNAKFNKTGEGAPNRTITWNSFEFSGSPVTVEIRTQTDFTNCIVRPKSYGYTCNRTVSKIAKFNITRNNQVMSVEFDYDYGSAHADIQDKLIIVADAPEINVPKNDSTVLYYGPGLHNVGKQIEIDSHIKTVYLAPGSLFSGGFKTTGGSVKITGRGILGGFWYKKHFEIYSWAMINMDAGSHHTIEGITIVDPSVFYIRALSDNLTVRNVKGIGAWTSETDGIETGNNALIEDSFFMTNDDAIKIYNSGMTVRRTVIWQSQQGAVFQLGWWPTHNVNHIRVSDIDIIHTDWCTKHGGHCRLGESDAILDLAGSTHQLTISDMEFRNIRIEGSCPRFLNVKMYPGARGNLTNVRLIDWSLEYQPTHDSYSNQLAGASPNGMLSGWSFVNFRVGGKCITSSHDADLVVDPHTTSHVSFLCSAQPAIVG